MFMFKKNYATYSTRNRDIIKLEPVLLSKQKVQTVKKICAIFGTIWAIFKTEKVKTIYIYLYSSKNKYTYILIR